MIKWTNEKIDFVVKKADEGVPYGEIVIEFKKEFGEKTTTDAITKRVYRARKGLHMPDDIEAAQEVITRFLPEGLSGEDIIDKLVEMGETIRKCDTTQMEVKVQLKPTTEWIMIVCSGDWHLENQNALVSKLSADLELIGNTEGIYYVFMGDETDNFIPKGKHAGGANEAILAPRYARKVSEAMFRKLNGKCLAMISGCHSQWSVEADDYNFVQGLAQDMGCSYMGSGGTMEIDLGDVIYRFAVRHKPQYNSRINPLHSCRVHLQRSDTTCDVVAMAHHHITAAATEYFQGRPVVFLRTGTYKPTDRFISGLGFRPSPCICPCVLINTQRKELRIAGSIPEGIDLLYFLNHK